MCWGADDSDGRCVYTSISVRAAIGALVALGLAIALGCEGESWLLVALFVLVALLFAVGAAVCCLTRPTFEEGSTTIAGRRKAGRA